MAARRLRKIDRLELQLASSGGSVKETKAIAKSLNLMEDRYMARPAAELLVEHSDPGAAQIAAGLAATPVLGRDPHGDRLRAAFKQAFSREGIPPDVEEMARAFYERRGQPKGKRGSSQQSDDWIGKTDEGGIFSSVRKLFGR